MRSFIIHFHTVLLAGFLFSGGSGWLLYCSWKLQVFFLWKPSVAEPRLGNSTIWPELTSFSQPSLRSNRPLCSELLWPVTCFFLLHWHPSLEDLTHSFFLLKNWSVLLIGLSLTAPCPGWSLQDNELGMFLIADHSRISPRMQARDWQGGSSRISYWTTISWKKRQALKHHRALLQAWERLSNFQAQIHGFWYISV